VGRFAYLVAAIAILATACGGQWIQQGETHGEKRLEPAKGRTMNTADPKTRYHEYLATFGITEPGERVAELRDLDLGDTRFFAFNSSDGLRLKAGVTPRGIVRPGGHSDDDWYGFLRALPDAASGAERIAWLETDASTPIHGLPRDPTVALIPDRHASVGIDPAQWALVTAPALLSGADGATTLSAWFREGGARVLTRWTVTARPAAPAFIEHAVASDLLATQAGGPAAAAADARARARQLLVGGTDKERWWALEQIRETGDRTAAPDVAALLGNAAASSNVRLLAAETLGRLADFGAVTALAAALRGDPAPEVRRAAARSLGGIGDESAIAVLTEAAPDEPEVTVRAEIVHALAGQGSVARATLEGIAKRDPDAGVRNLARASLRPLPGPGN
jgi:hypothetical protein